MTNTDIAKIRQLLKKAKQEVESLSPAGIAYPLYKERIPVVTLNKALTLLPCETCGGTGTLPKIESIPPDGLSIGSKPCPDCKS